MEKRSMAKMGSTALAIAGLWLFIAGMLALEFGSAIPQSREGRLLFVVVGPPLYLLSEAFAEWMWSTRPARALAVQRSAGFRILVGVVIGSALVVAEILISARFFKS